MVEITAPKSKLPAKLKGVHFFGFDSAPCSQRVSFALAEKGLLRGKSVPWRSDQAAHCKAKSGTYTFRNVSLITHQNLTEEFAAIQPNMVVPALVHDGRLFIESMEIIDYLDQAFPENPLIPTDPTIAELNQELVELGKSLHVSIRHMTFGYSLGKLGKLDKATQQRLDQLEANGSPEQLAEFYTAFSSDGIARETFLSHLHALEEGYAAQEARLKSDNRRYLTGDCFATADIIWAIKVLRLTECGYPFEKNFPYLAKWYQHVSQRVGFRDGVIGKNRFFHHAFRVKARIEKFFGKDIQKDSNFHAAQQAH